MKLHTLRPTKRTITVADYRQMKPYTQKGIHRLVEAGGVSINDVFLLEIEDQHGIGETWWQRVDIHVYERDEDGHHYLNTDGEIAFRIVTIYTGLYEAIV